MKKSIQLIHRKFCSTGRKTTAFLADKRGEIATNTIGGIIVGVIVIGLLIVAVNSFFPSFFDDMFSRMADKLNANW